MNKFKLILLLIIVASTIFVMNIESNITDIFDNNLRNILQLLKALKKYVSVENKLDIEIEKPGKRNYLIRFTILKKDDGTELLIAFTNWSVKKKEFEKEIEIEIESAEKEIESLKKESLKNISTISEEMASKVIEQISGEPMNQSSIKAAVLEAAKNNLGKYL